MDLQETQLPQNHWAVVQRLVTVCQADDRVLAAFLGGSYARGTQDSYSDLDLYLITREAAFHDFCAERKTFIRSVGEPLFLEDFGASDGLLYIFSDGSEGELWIGSQNRFHHMHEGPYRVLLDKKGVLVNAVFPDHKADLTKQVETLQQQVNGFWHELSHFIKAMGRRQLWFAYGQLEAMRRICVNLTRLRYNFSDAYVGEEPYFKIEGVMPVEQLSPLQTTYCPMEYEAMYQAALLIFRFYQDAAPTLAREHGIAYQADLERIMFSHLEKLGNVDLR